MGRKIVFNLLEGTGTALAPANGWLSIRPTNEYANGNFLVIATTTEERVRNGMVTFPDVQPTPAMDPNSGKYPWAYIVRYRDDNGYSKSWNVLVPTGTGDLQGSQLVQVVPDGVHYNIMQGPAGPAGDGLHVYGAYPTFAALQAANPHPKRGDSFLVGSKLYVWDGTAWGASSDLQGAKGDKGDKGATGERGATGLTGEKGDTGVTPNINAIANTGAPGSTVTVDQSGTPESPVLAFTIPRGDPGLQGPQGAKGDPGEKGDTGDIGAGVPTGGEINQVVVSNGAGSSSWANITDLPNVATTDTVTNGDASTLDAAKAYADSLHPPRTKNLPAGITDRPGSFNTTTKVYTPDSFVRSGARSALESSKAGNQLAGTINAANIDLVTTTQIVYMGDSEVVGTGAVVGTQDASAQAMAQLRTAGYTMSDGMILCNDNNLGAGLTNRDSRIAMTGTWLLAGNSVTPTSMDYQYHVSSKVSGSSLTFSFRQPTTRIDLYVFGNTAPFTYQVDSGSVTTYTPTGNNQVETIKISGLTSAVHTLKVTTTTTGTVYVLGARGYTAYSSEISKVGFWGAFAPAGLPRTWWSSPELLARTQPDAVVLQYGTNEALKGGFTTEQYKGLMLGVIQMLRSKIPGVSVYLMSSFQPNVTDPVWTTWRNAQYDIADSAGIRLGDCVAKVGNRTTATAAGLYSDATHPNAAGYAKQGQLVKDMLLM